jgi:hypothetical protein
MQFYSGPLTHFLSGVDRQDEKAHCLTEACTFAAIAAAPAEECRLLLTRSSPRGECMTPPGLPPLADIPLHTVENPQRAPVDVLGLSVSHKRSFENTG